MNIYHVFSTAINEDSGQSVTVFSDIYRFNCTHIIKTDIPLYGIGISLLASLLDIPPTVLFGAEVDAGHQVSFLLSLASTEFRKMSLKTIR